MPQSGADVTLIEAARFPMDMSWRLHDHPRVAWRAMPSRSDAYPKHFRDIVVPELPSLSGFLGAHLSQRQIGDQVEFLVLTRWQSMEAIGAFTGSSVDKAVVEPGAIAALIDFDDTVQHYIVIEDVSVLSAEQLKSDPSERSPSRGQSYHQLSDRHR